MGKDNENKNLSITEKLSFLQKEYEYNRERKNGLLERTYQLFTWNVAIFGFVFIFFKYDLFFNYLKNCYINKTCTIRTVFLIDLLLIMFAGIVLCCISFAKLFFSFKTDKINCFDIDELIEKSFDADNIINDYKEILKDYDKSCENIALKNDFAFLFMVIGFILVIVSLILITVLLYTQPISINIYRLCYL